MSNYKQKLRYIAEKQFTSEEQLNILKLCHELLPYEVNFIYEEYNLAVLKVEYTFVFPRNNRTDELSVDIVLRVSTDTAYVNDLNEISFYKGYTSPGASSFFELLTEEEKKLFVFHMDLLK